MPYLLVKSVCCSNSMKKKKMIENRKADLKSILKTFKDVSKSEISRTKNIFEEHKELFSKETEVIPVVVKNDDTFFTSN